MLRPGMKTKTELYIAVKHFAKLRDLDSVLIALEASGIIIAEQDRTRPGRPATCYAIAVEAGHAERLELEERHA